MQAVQLRKMKSKTSHSQFVIYSKPMFLMFRKFKSYVEFTFSICRCIIIIGAWIIIPKKTQKDQIPIEADTFLFYF